MPSPSSSAVLPLVLAYGLSVLLSAPFASPDRLILAGLLVPALIWLSQTDLRRHEIPDTAVMIIAATGVLFQWRLLGSGVLLLAEVAVSVLLTALLWAAGGLYFRRTGREAFGIGDAKLAGAGALVTGSASVWAMLLVASAGGIAAGLLTRLNAGDGGQSGIPFGPFLAYAIFIFALFPFPGLQTP